MKATVEAILKEARRDPDAVLMVTIVGTNIYYATAHNGPTQAAAMLNYLERNLNRELNEAEAKEREKTN